MVTHRKIKMTVTMDVTIPQALSLQAMFEYWRRCGSLGRSREVGFYVDGDGNFQPKCEVTFSDPIPKLTDELRELAIRRDRDGNRAYDFDAIAWKLDTQRNEEQPKRKRREDIRSVAGAWKGHEELREELEEDFE